MNPQYVLVFKTDAQKDQSLVVPYADLTKTPAQIKTAMQAILSAAIFSYEGDMFASLGVPYSVETVETSVSLT